jgi:hypothetical protein
MLLKYKLHNTQVLTQDCFTDRMRPRGKLDELLPWPWNIDFLDEHYRVVNLTVRLSQEHDMNTYVVGEAHLQALLTSIADESEMMILAPVAVSPRKDLRDSLGVTQVGPKFQMLLCRKKKHSLPSGNQTYISLDSSL